MANDKQLQLTSKVLITSNVREYHETIEKLVTEDSNVLEVGCKDGQTSAQLAIRTKKLIAIDHTEDAIEQARKVYPLINFEVVDGFDVLAVHNLSKEKVDIIYINFSQISGYSSILDSISLINMYAAVMNPGVIVVQNKALKAFAGHCLAWSSSPRSVEIARNLQSRPGTAFVGTRGVEEFRESISVWVTNEDNVLEIGCEWGTTTELIAERAKAVIGTDISPKCIAKAREMRPQVQFDVLDGFDVRAALDLGKNFSVIYIDISGLSGYRSLLDVICLLSKYETLFKPKAIIIKSGALKHFANHYIAWNSHRASD